ncbi:MAG: class II aldolase/adducin family protein [Oscillospiraceae bacterium]|nr:class II aldolase/adducin family protein [Oscillospiraceae bacterium]
MNIDCIHPADRLVMYMQRIYDKGLTTTSGGNLSILDEEGNIWITPAGIDKGTLTRRDIVCVKADGTAVGIHRPSSELPFHKAVYQMRPDIKAVLHAHPPGLVSFSIARKVPNPDLMPSVRDLCGEIRIAAYAVPGSEQLGENIGKCFMEGCSTVLLENHGVCVGAKDLLTAFLQFEMLEFLSKLEITAKRIGNLLPVTADDLEAMKKCMPRKMESFVPECPSAEELSARRDMITLIRRGCRQGLFGAARGTCSVRLADGSFLITPDGTDLTLLEEADVVRVKGGRGENGKNLSRSAALLQMIYEKHPEISAVLLAQPVHSMAFAVTDAALDPRTIPESYVFLRDVKRMSYREYYEDPERIAAYFSETRPAAIIDNYCIVVTGSSLLQAFDRLEVFELTAESIIDTAMIGDIVHISDDEIADLKKAFHLKD